MNAEWILLPSLGNSPLPASCGLAHWWLCPILELCYYEVLSLLGNSTYTEILLVYLHSSCHPLNISYLSTILHTQVSVLVQALS